MGRPLFSASYSTPAVRTEPEPAQPAILYEKWTRWNAFDPDSDEFFNSEDAVFEAFLDPADVEASTEERERQRQRPRPVQPEPVDVMIVRELEERSDSSSSSSEGTVSGRGSPMAVGSDDPAGMLADAYRAGEFEPRNTARRQRVALIHDGMPPLRDIDDDERTATTVLDILNDRRVSRVMPHSPFRSRGFIPRFSDTRPNTPPHQRTHTHNDHVIPELAVTPSPAPTVTPRLYSWSSSTPFGRDSVASPTPVHRQRQRDRTSPLTNPSARMSLPHLSPAPVRVRMA